MKAITIRMTKEDLDLLKRIKELGFSSIKEVIKCATLSFIQEQKKDAA